MQFDRYVSRVDTAVHDCLTRGSLDDIESLTRRCLMFVFDASC